MDAKRIYLIISAEDDDDLAWEKIGKLLLRYPRMVPHDNEGNSNLNELKDERVLESKLSKLLEFRRRDSPYMRFNPVDPGSEEDAKDETTKAEVDDNNEKQETTKAQTQKPKSKHVQMLENIRRKLTDKKTKITLSLPVAAIIFGSTILVTCCCSLYLRNRLVACVNRITGRKKKKSKMLHVDTERGRSTPRKRGKTMTSKKNRARSLSQDITNMPAYQSSAVTMTNENDEASTTGCYRCCKKKKKRRK